MRTLGRMRGRPCTQPFLVEIKKGATACRPNGIFLLPRWATRSPPHQSPSVTASPQGEAFAGGTLLQQNTFSTTPRSRKMRIQIRARTWATKQPNHRPAAPHHAKTSEWERAGHKKRGSRGLAPGPLSPHFSGEMGTPAGQAGPPGRCAPRHRKSLDHSKGTQYRTPLTPRRSAHSPPPSE